MPSKRLSLGLLACLLCCSSYVSGAGVKDGTEGDAPHVFVALQARNCAHLLPNFFGYLENLDYPKKRISVW